MANNPHFSSSQFRPMMVPTPQSQPFVPVASSNFQQPVRSGTLMNPPVPFSQPLHQLPSRPGPPGHGTPPLPAGTIPNAPPNVLNSSGQSLPPPAMQPPSSFIPVLNGPRVPHASSYTFAPPSYGQPTANFNAGTVYQGGAQMHASSGHADGQQAVTSETHSNSALPQQNHEPLSAIPGTSYTGISLPLNQEHVRPVNSLIQNKANEDIRADWIEHVSTTGRRYYYNRRTQVSSWEKPLELMSPMEKADASTNWKEFTSPDGRKYYYNKLTKQSKWEIPEELKLARDKIANESTAHALQENNQDTYNRASTDQPSDQKSVHNDPSSSADDATGKLGPQIAATTSTSSVVDSCAIVVPKITTEQRSNSGDDLVSSSLINSADIAMKSENSHVDKELSGKPEMGEKDRNDSSEGKYNNPESASSHDKQEAKNAFKALLESANVGSDWTWEQAMRAIINDQRYGAVKTLAERKQAFNEFLAQKKKQVVEEKRLRQKKARNDFRKMLEEADLTSSTRWSKALGIIEKDSRFKAVERERDRRDLFDEFLKELGEKERSRAQEERKQNILAYRQFLESCDFIKPSTQWRKVQDRLEADERCSRLEKIDRLEIFQDFLRDLEREEEEQRKIQKEEQRKIERKNRDDFRKLMDSDVLSGSLTAKTHWRDYYTKVKDSAVYVAVSSNTSGSTPKDLFEDVADELQKQYHDDKIRVKDAIKAKKFALTTKSTLEELKDAIADDLRSPPLSNVNLKLVFEDLVERVKEKKRKRDYDGGSVGDEDLRRETFEEVVDSDRRRKEEKAKKEKDRDDKERRKSKQKRDKDADVDISDDGKRPSGENSKHHRNFPDAEKDRSRASRKHHGGSQKKSRRRSTPDSDAGSKQRKHRKDQGYDDGELEDGEFGVEGDTR